MSIEDMIRTELEGAVATVPPATRAPLEVVERRGRRRRTVSRIARAASGVAVFAVVVGISIAIGRIGYVPDVAEPTVPPATTAPLVSDGTLLIAGEEFGVGELVEAFADVPMYLGQDAPAARFDTAPLGDEQSLSFGQVKVADADVLDGPTIYVGEVSAESVFVNERSNQACLWIGPTPQFCGDWGAFELSAPSRDGPAYGTWLGVPKATSVVVLRSDGDPIAWQSPIGGISLMALPGSGAFEMAALDETGVQLETIEFDTSSGIPDTTVPGGPTTTVP